MTNNTDLIQNNQKQFQIVIAGCDGIDFYVIKIQIGTLSSFKQVNTEQFCEIFVERSDFERISKLSDLEFFKKSYNDSDCDSSKINDNKASLKNTSVGIG